MKIIMALCAVVSLTGVNLHVQAEEVSVQVKERINERPDPIVRQSARLRATYLGMNKLPVIVKGSEALTNGRYEEYLSALGAAYVDVLTVQESWDREAGELTLTAKVSVDNEKVSAALTQIGDSEYAWSQLKRIQKTMDRLLAGGSINEHDANDLEVIRASIFVSPMIRTTVNESLLAKASLIEAMANQIRAKLKENIDGLTMEVVDVSSNSMTISVKGDDSLDAKSLFPDPLLRDFYELHSKDILNQAGTPCLQVHKYRWLYHNIPATRQNHDNMEFAEADYYDTSEKRRVDVGQAAVLTMTSYPLNDRIRIEDSSNNARSFFDLILESPADYLNFGICIYAPNV